MKVDTRNSQTLIIFVQREFFEGEKKPLKRVFSPQTPLFLNFLTKNSIEYTVCSQSFWEKRGYRGERTLFLLKQHTAYSKRVSLPLKNTSL